MAEPIVTNPVAAVVIAVPLLLRVSVLFAPLVVLDKVVATVLVKLIVLAELSALKLMISAPATLAGPRMVRVSPVSGTTLPDQVVVVFHVPEVAPVQL